MPIEDCEVLERFTKIQSNIEAVRNSLDVIEGCLIDYCDTHEFGNICPKRPDLSDADVRDLRLEF